MCSDVSGRRSVAAACVVFTILASCGIHLLSPVHGVPQQRRDPKNVIKWGGLDQIVEGQ